MDESFNNENFISVPAIIDMIRNRRSVGGMVGAWCFCLRFVILSFPDHTHLLFLAVCRAHRDLPVEFLLLRCSVLFAVEFLSLLYLLVIS